MTRQEIAVALSHIETWRRAIAGDDAAALILEDARGHGVRFRSAAQDDGAQYTGIVNSIVIGILNGGEQQILLLNPNC